MNIDDLGYCYASEEDIVASVKATTVEYDEEKEGEGADI